MSTCATAVSDLSLRIMSVTPLAWPLAVSTISRSTPASTSAIARFQASSKNPMAAPTRNRPDSSLVARGYCSVLTKSLTVNRPLSRPASSTSGSFSILLLASSASASILSTPTRAVTSGMGVITSEAGRLKSVSKRRSRLVMMPTSRPSWSMTGRPEIWNRPHSSSTSASVASPVVVTGSETMPDSERFTRSTCRAWSSIERLRCRMPMPPWRAIAMAIRDSVTVSIAAETSGSLTEMLRDSRVEVSTSLGMTSVAPGSSSTSSKVRPRATKGAGTAESEAAGELIFRFYGRQEATTDVPIVLTFLVKS